MHAVEKSREMLSLRVEETGFPRILGFLCAAALVWGTWQAFRHDGFWRREQFQGSVAAVLIFGFGALVTWERASFVFDLRKRELTWRRDRPWKRAAGTVPFDAIRYVGAEVSISSRRTPMLRIVVETDAGAIPVTAGYSADPGRERAQIAAGVREFLGILQRPVDPQRVCA